MFKKFRVNRNLFLFFILFVGIESFNLDKFYFIIDKFIVFYKSFRIDVSDLVYLFELIKSINLKIDNKGYIKRFFCNFFDILFINGFNVKFFGDNFIFFVNLGYVFKDYKK